MVEFDLPTYVIDFKDKKNCSRIRHVQLNEVTPILVLPTETQGLSILAEGQRREDGFFYVKVTTDAGEQTHRWTYEFLMDAVRVHCPD